MIRPAALTAALLLMWAASAASSGVAEDAAEASAELQQAVAALQAAEGAKDRVAALTQTIKAYEEGLAALREALRQAELRETALTLQFQTKRDRIAQLLGVLSRIDAFAPDRAFGHGPLWYDAGRCDPGLAGGGQSTERPVAGTL